MSTGIPILPATLFRHAWRGWDAGAMDQRVSFITLAVADIPRTRAFYVDGLGWEPIRGVDR